MDKKSFEEKLDELEKIVKKLEAGDVMLDEATKYFKKATELAASCEKDLKEAHTSINKVLNNKDELEEFKVEG